MSVDTIPRIHRPHWPSTLVIGLVLTIVGLLLPTTAWGQKGPIANFLDEDHRFEIVAEGDGWQTLRATDPNMRATPDATLVAVWPKGIATAPLPESIKAELYDDFGVKPGRKAMLEVSDRAISNDVIVIDKALAEAIDSGASLDPWAAYADDTSEFKASCGWKTKTKRWDWSFDEWTENRNFNLPGNLTGNLNIDVPLRGHANLDFTYKYKTTGFIFCIPYKFRFESARLHGNVDILGSSDLTASFTVAGQWSNEWQVLNERLGSTTFWVGPIPVYLEYRLPVYVGYEIAAQLEGTVNVDTSFGVSGTFDYTCTRDNCTGSSNFNQGPQQDQVTGGIELDVRAQLNARAMFRVELYDDDFLYAEAGAKGLLDGHLWGYYGNNCGDGDGNGINETVEALVAEADAGYDWVYGYGGILGDRLWTSTGQRWFLGYWDLLGEGNSTALSAMIHGPSEVLVGETASYDISLRPCYPFDEPVLFGMAPGNWGGELVNIAKGETKTVTHVFGTTGGKQLRARLAGDTKGRPIRINQFRNIQVRHPEPEAALVLSYIPSNGGNRRTYRADEPGQTPTQTFLYNEDLGNFEERPGAPCGDGSENPTYLKIKYDGPTVTGCRFRTQLDPNPIECWQNLIDTFNSNEFFIVNTDTNQTLPSTCELNQPLLRVCGPNDYCYAQVEFDLPNGTSFTRFLAYRKYF